MSRIRTSRASWFAGAALALLGSDSFAQFDHRWAEFQPNPGMLSLPPMALSAPADEPTFAHGDLDQDGWIDLVVARKQGFFSIDPRANYLLMNEGGVLVNRTSKWASASDVPGDTGFKTPTSDTSVLLVDVDQDGLLDVVTSVQSSDAVPKAVGHPRVYRNLGFAGGLWLGLRHEDGRIPQLRSVGGLPVNPRFTTVSAGDVDGDGDLDLYFCDNDGYSSAGENPADDTEDQLLRNDGNGYFTVDSTLVSHAARVSQFGLNAVLVDLNLDGALDLFKNKDTTTSSNVSAIYSVGGVISSIHGFHAGSSYSSAVGDLNRDGRPDAILGQDSIDAVRYNLFTGANQEVTWGGALPFQFLAGGDDGFAGPPEVVDLDEDGWNDVMIADQDIVVPFSDRRLHVYHNPGGSSGAQIQLVEERENATTSGWLGAVGLHLNDLKGTFETESFDVDRDGDRDLVLGRAVGTYVWENVTVVCQEDLGYGTPGGATLSMCGNPLKADGTSDFRLAGAPPATPVYVIVGLSANPTPVLGGTLVPDQVGLIVQTVTSAAGELLVPAVPAFPAPGTLFVQCVYVDGAQPTGAGFSNALKIVSG